MLVPCYEHHYKKQIKRLKRDDTGTNIVSLILWLWEVWQPRHFIHLLCPTCQSHWRHSMDLALYPIEKRKLLQQWYRWDFARYFNIFPFYHAKHSLSSSTEQGGRQVTSTVRPSLVSSCCQFWPCLPALTVRWKPEEPLVRHMFFWLQSERPHNFTLQRGNSCPLWSIVPTL